MKKILLLLFTFFSLVSFGQAPQGLNYQAVIRNNSGIPIPNQAVGVKFQIHQGSSGGIVVYEENHSTTSDQLGSISLVIGKGISVSCSTCVAFNTINWASGIYFNEVLIDSSGGTNYVTMGASQLWSVPYALYAQNGPPGPTGPQGPQGPPGVGGGIFQQTVHLLDDPNDLNYTLNSTTSNGSEIYLAFDNDGKINVVALTEDVNTGQYRKIGDRYITPYVNLNANGLAVMDTFIYSYGYSSPNYVAFRFPKSLLGNTTPMTFVGPSPSTSNSNKALFSDGTYLYIYDNGQTFAKYSVSGTDLNTQAAWTINGGSIGLPLSAIYNNGKVLILDANYDLTEVDVNTRNVLSTKDFSGLNSPYAYGTNSNLRGLALSASPIVYIIAGFQTPHTTGPYAFGCNLMPFTKN